MSAIRVPVLLAVCLVLPSCAPPFDPGLSQAVKLIQKMELEAHIGPLDWTDRSTLESNALFAPIRTGDDIDRTRGFIRSTLREDTRVWYVWGVQDGGSTEYSAVPDGNAWTANMPEPFPGYPTYLIQNLISGPAFVTVQFDPMQSSAWIWNVDTGQDPPETGMFSSCIFQSQLTPVINPDTYSTTLGGQVFPNESGAHDRLYCLVRAVAGGDIVFWEVQSQITSTTIDTFTPITSSISLPFLAGAPPADRSMYFHDSAGKKSYASLLVNEDWQCWTWTTDPVKPPVRLPGTTRRIDALLTTGRLFSVQDGIGTVYSANGVELTRFPLGVLRFACETYVSGDAVALFSLMTVTDRTVDFYVYSIPTEDLDSLN